MIKSDDVFVSPVNVNMSPVRKHQHRHNVNNRYDFIKTLGKGNYGKVKLARHKENDQLVAVKAIRKEKVKDSTDMRHIRREIEIMSSIQHQHIIQIYEVFENEDKIVIVMEYAAGGELYDYLTLKPNISDEEAKFFFRQIVSAIRYCHNSGIVHRDIKLENILLDDNHRIKIADFGLANSFRSDKYLETFCGSPLYASPEIVCGVPYKGPEVDSWSLGVLLYTLVYGRMPFDGVNHATLTKQITSGVFAKPRKQSGAHELIRWLLKVNPSERATINDVAAHHWLAPFPEEKLSPPASLAPLGSNSRSSKSQKTNVEFCSTPKSILKHRIGLKDKPHSEPATPCNEATLAQKLAAVCGLSPRSSLALKHNVLRGKRDRESGYYSSPERARRALRDTSSVSDPTLFNSSECCRPSKSSAHPIVSERCSWPSTHCSSSAPLKATNQHRFASISSDDGCSVSQTRTASMCSDSSALSSDSFDICPCDCSNSPRFTSPASTNGEKPAPRQRPVSLNLPSTPEVLGSPARTAPKKPSSGSLTPKSEMLDRELERILAPSGRRRRRQIASCVEQSGVHLPGANKVLSPYDAKLHYECRSNINACAKVGLTEV